MTSRWVFSPAVVDKKQITGCPECFEYWAHQKHMERERKEGEDNPGPKVPEGVVPYLPKENPHC